MFIGRAWQPGRMFGGNDCVSHQKAKLLLEHERHVEAFWIIGGLRIGLSLGMAEAVVLKGTCVAYLVWTEMG